MEEDITHKIIGAAYNVFNTLGFDFLEDTSGVRSSFFTRAL